MLFFRDYKWKYERLKGQLKRPAHLPKQFKMRVRRRHIFEDSFQQMQFAGSRVEVLKSRLIIPRYIFDAKWFKFGLLQLVDRI